MDDKVPDYFKDPLEEPADKAFNKFKELIKKYETTDYETISWACGLMSLWEQARRDPEEDAPAVEEMTLGELNKHTYLLTKMVGLLEDIKKQLKNPVK